MKIRKLAKKRMKIWKFTKAFVIQIHIYKPAVVLFILLEISVIHMFK